MACEKTAEPGRVKCSAELRVAAGSSISWADVALIELPEFTSALKGRLGPSDATISEPAQRRWAFGLVAKKSGEGTATLRVRAVVCRATDAGAPRCEPLTIDVRGAVRVGS